MAEGFDPIENARKAIKAGRRRINAIGEFIPGAIRGFPGGWDPGSIERLPPLPPGIVKPNPWAAGGKELDKSQGIPAAFPFGNGLSVQPSGGVDQASAITQGVTPIGKFAVVLLLFALAVFFLPKGIRGWFVLIIILGALTVNPGAIKEFQQWTGV